MGADFLSGGEMQGIILVSCFDLRIREIIREILGGRDILGPGVFPIIDKNPILIPAQCRELKRMNPELERSIELVLEHNPQFAPFRIPFLGHANCAYYQGHEGRRHPATANSLQREHLQITKVHAQTKWGDKVNVETHWTKLHQGKFELV